MTIIRKSLKDLSISKSDLKRLDAMRDEDIDYSDIPELDEDFWKNAVLIEPGTMQKEEQISIIDSKNDSQSVTPRSK